MAQVVDPESQHGLQERQIVFIARLDTKISIQMLAELIGGHVGGFPAVICHHKLPQCVPMVFGTGKMAVVGTLSIYDALLSTYQLMDSLSRVNVFPRLHAIKVCNVVCSLYVGHCINIEAIARDFPFKCNFDKELFGGLHFTYRENYKSKHDKKPQTTVFIIFSTGNVVITGGTTKQSIRKDLKAMIPLLRHYRAKSEGRHKSKVGVGEAVDTLALESASGGKKRKLPGSQANGRRKKQKVPFGYKKPSPIPYTCVCGHCSA